MRFPENQVRLTVVVRETPCKSMIIRWPRVTESVPLVCSLT